jgi:hypothetical protein
VGVPVLDAGVTTTLNVTLVPAVTAVADAVSAVVDAVRAGAVTVTEVAPEMLAANAELPAYDAVIEWLTLTQEAAKGYKRLPPFNQNPKFAESAPNAN